MRKLLFPILILLAALPAMAQKNINSAIERLEKDKTTQYVAYSENRNPTTHKIYKASKVMVVSDKAAETLRQAFNRDREKATSFEMARNSSMIEIRFQSTSDRSTYTLLRQRNGTWLLTVEILNMSNSPAGRRRSSCEIPAAWPVIWLDV